MGTVNGGKSRVKAGVHVGCFGVASCGHQIGGSCLNARGVCEVAAGDGGIDGSGIHILPCSLKVLCLV